ncbi:MGMT family protein [Mycobacterium sp.]|uniref:MGMT family protein n=2 Tax=Mycobacterium sp. TaxID=1785 RepID=UPI003C777860
MQDATTTQAVDQAVGRNPLSIIVPCHRVVGNNGKRTGKRVKHPNFHTIANCDLLSRLSYLVFIETRSQLPDLVHGRPRSAVWQLAAQSDLQMESQVVT